jgi:hypothetical protein
MLAVVNRVPISRHLMLFAVALVAVTSVAHAGEIETEHLFGFTTGADVGNVGERELESEITNRFGKQAGSYNALSQTYEAKITPVENFRIGATTTLAYFGVSGVPGLMDRQQATLQGLSFAARYKLIDSQRGGPFSLTIIAEPRWDRLDDVSGDAISGYGGTLTVAVDKELIANRLFGAMNMLYDAEASHLIVAGWQHESRIGISAALSMQVRPALFVGGEVRYLRSHDGLGLDRLSGQAAFVGPTMYYQISKQLAVSAAWNFQVSGQSSSGGSLDLTHFERQQAKVRLNYSF